MDKINIIKNKKGFTYIITVTVIISLIAFMFILFKPIPKTNSNTDNLIDNYKQELVSLTITGADETDFNTFTNNFYNYVISQNYTIKLCNIIDMGNTQILLVNYLGQDYSGTSNNSYSLVAKTTDLDVNLGDCMLDYNSSDKIKYFIEISDNTTKKKYNN